MPSKIKYLIEFVLFCSAVIGHYFYLSKNVAIVIDRQRGYKEKLEEHIASDSCLHSKNREDHNKIFDKIDHLKDMVFKP